MKPVFPLLAFATLVLAALACSAGGDEILPPIETLEPEQPTPTPEGGGVDADGFFSLNLTESDAQGLEERASEIYQRLVNAGGEVDRGALLAAYAELANYERVGGEWRAAGPAPIDAINMPQGKVPGSGRVNGFAIDLRSSDVVYAAASVGGLWKTEDGGQTWRSLTDDQVPLIYGGIVMDPGDPDTLYALLGEFDGQLSSDYGFLANGIMRTRDAGETWELIGAEEFNAASVTALVFDGEGNLYAASGQTAVYSAPPGQPEFGVFKSTDSGDTWERLISCSDFGNCLPGEESGVTAYLGGFMDLDISGDGTLYAALCNVECYGAHLLRSRDGGASWEELDVSAALQVWEQENEVSLQLIGADNDVPYIEGFEIAASQSDPNVVMAGGGLYWVDQDENEGPWSWVIRSTDGGDTWEWLPEVGDYCSGGGSSPQCTYDNIVEIDPTDANVMYVGGSFSEDQDTFAWYGVVRRSADGGETWADMTPPEEGSLMHPDAHGLAFDPNDPNVAWVGGDGGIYRTSDASADPPQWESLSEGLNTLLFIGIGLHPTDPNYILGGLQDNANAFTEDGGQTWHGASQGDGGDAAVDPFQPDIVFSFQYQNSLSRNESGGHGDGQAWFGQDWQGYSEGLEGGDNWLFYPPYVLDPNTEGVMYVASNFVYQSEDRGDSWYVISDALTEGAIQSIAIAPGDSNVLYVGTTDGYVWTTTDGGGSWEDVTGASFPLRNVTHIAVDPDDPQTAYAAFGGFDVQTPDAPGHVFVTSDGGANWDDITLNLPDAPLSSAVVDVRPDYAGVYVGGALGVWVLQEGADEWLPFGTGMPFTIVSDLELNPETGILAAATYGRSVWVMEMP
ncbi:MAG TPA: hypothetical protein VI793_18620 [Anaerolineales bacterium]|nr:hypothetical protein [Anaerolineales bacterium]